MSYHVYADDCQIYMPIAKNYFKFDKQINGGLKSGFYYLPLLCQVKLFFYLLIFLTKSCMLDYCDALYSGISHKALRHAF